LAHLGLEALPGKKKSQSLLVQKEEQKEAKTRLPFKEMKPMEPFSGGMTPAFNEYYDLGMKGGQVSLFLIIKVILIRVTKQVA
jgi:hypothetical protein